MNTYNILIETGYTFEFDCQIVAKSPHAARKEWYARNNMQGWRTIKATRVKEHTDMATTTYNLTGVFGTMLTVIVEHNDNNATSVDMRILAVSDDAPEFFVDALTIEEEFIIARCFDGNAHDGEQWALALDDDGQLTHEAHAFNPQYVETFTVNVKD